MQVITPSLSGLRLLELRIFSDNRGFFVERFNEERFATTGVPTHFCQDNHSRSAPGVVRGLHYQSNPAQGKLVGVVRGSIWDVVVDIRRDSPTFGRHHAVVLSDSNGLLLWIPPGFAHGFCVLGTEAADVLYKVDTPYSATTEGGLLWNDPELALAWPIQNPILSAKDLELPTFAEYSRHPVFR